MPGSPAGIAAARSAIEGSAHAPTAATADWPTWPDRVMVDAGAVPSADVVYVTTDGSAASGSNFNFAIQGGQAVIVPNRQPKLNGLQANGNSWLDFDGNANGVGITSHTVVKIGPLVNPWRPYGELSEATPGYASWRCSVPL